MRKIKDKGMMIFLAVVVLGVGLLGYQNFIQPLIQKSGNNGGPGAGEVPCIDPALPIPPAYHIHPNLKIIVNGQNITIPANIGINLLGCERVLHTHNESGQLHIEPNFYQEFTLGQFFAEWGKTFSPTQILENKVDDSHELLFTVDGRPNNDYGNLILKDKQNIAIEYRGKQKTR